MSKALPLVSLIYSSIKASKLKVRTSTERGMHQNCLIEVVSLNYCKAYS
jgi:hypothetical protein